MTGIHAAIERNQRVYRRLFGGQVQVEPRLPELQNQAESPAFEWVRPEMADFALPSESFAFGRPPVEEAGWEAAGFTLSPAPVDLLETAELLGRMVEVEERFVSQNLEREER